MSLQCTTLLACELCMGVSQCDQIGMFLIRQGDKFSYKRLAKLRKLFLLQKKLCFGQLLEKWANFYSCSFVGYTSVESFSKDAN